MIANVTVRVPANTTHRLNVGPMLVHRLRCRPNIRPTLGGCVVFARVPTTFLSQSDILYIELFRSNHAYYTVALCRELKL